MKLLSIAVPSYNSQDYLRRCLDSLVVGGEDVEIIVIDDGSKDHTADIAREYVARYPGIVRLEQKENGGHGSAVNRGLDVATGIYYKVVDSDDWLDYDAYMRVLDCLLKEEATGVSLDLLIVNYVYEYFYNGTRNIVNYSNVFPQNCRFGWEYLRKMRISQLLLMHSLIYRTELLHDCGVRLPEHTFYVDNIIAYQPLPFAKQIMYVDADFYRYFIGRPDQSVNTSNMIKRIDQQLLVTRTLLHFYHLDQDVQDPYLRRYMYRYMSMMVTITIVHLVLADNDVSTEKITQLWQDIRQYDLRTYRIIRRNFINRAISIPGRSGRFLTRKGFSLARRIYKFS
ncbi:MAG: glycosyltransferase [Clostridiaceae bacterium]|nr:glycosyltransferase [Clostridiaceae bacterium]